MAQESRGAHAREDYSERLDGEWMKHTIAHFDTEAGTTRISYRPNNSHTMDEAECKAPLSCTYHPLPLPILPLRIRNP
ncbi:hypothetical protein B484DRAFT_415204 [Ochromonadaceae sp. CCMP2298]|nr:hypothetical protein B484DRAFT_415204 [Ochromonadaceae sp. CCMP2298]